MKDITLYANRSIQEKLEKILSEPYGTVNLTVIVDKEDPEQNQHFRIVQLNDIDTEHPENQRFDLYYLESGHEDHDIDFVDLSGAIEYSVFMIW